MERLAIPAAFRRQAPCAGQGELFQGAGILDALIGHSGFVGGFLDGQHRFAARFNSRSIGEAIGQSFDTLVCAAAPGSMFEANRFPESDRQRIDELMGQLADIRARRVILISTIATLAGFAAEDERSGQFEQDIAYGRHRHELELFVQSRFPDHLIVRLPALFGPGLKKNFLFDILNPVPSMLVDGRLADLRAALDPRLAGWVGDLYSWREEWGLHVLDRQALDRSGRREELDAAVTAAGFSAVGFTHPQSRFQYYDMRRLWSDIGTGLAAGLRLLHLAPQPVAAADIFHAVTGGTMPDNSARVHAEDMRTGHAALWNRTGPYIADAPEILADIANFAAGERASA